KFMKKFVYIIILCFATIANTYSQNGVLISKWFFDAPIDSSSKMIQDILVSNPNLKTVLCKKVLRANQKDISYVYDGMAYNYNFSNNKSADSIRIRETFENTDTVAEAVYKGNVKILKASYYLRDSSALNDFFEQAVTDFSRVSEPESERKEEAKN